MVLVHNSFFFKRRIFILGFILLAQGASFATSENPSGGNGHNQKPPGFIFGYLKPPPILENIINGAQNTLKQIIPKTPPVVENILKNAQDVFQKIVPMPFRQEEKKDESIRTTPTTTTTTTPAPAPKPPAKAKPFNPLEGLFNIIPGFKPLLDVFQIHPPPTTTTTTTTTTTPAPPPKNLPFGGFFANIWNNLVKKPEPPRPTTTTTIMPTPPGGRGLSGLVFNFENIYRNFIELKDVITMKSTHWQPGYGVKTVQDMIKSTLAIKDIFLQSNQEGGLGEIVTNIKDVIKNLVDLNKLLKSKQPGHMLFVGFTIQNLLKNAGELKDDFMIKLPPMTTPASGINLQNLGVNLPLGDLDFGESNNNTAVADADPKAGEIEQLVIYTERFLTAVLNIEKIIESENPNSSLLKGLGKIRVAVENALSTIKVMDKQSIIQAIPKIFPHATAADMVAKIGEFLKKLFPKIEIIQTLGNILEQKFLVNLVLSNLNNLGIGMKMGNIKDAMLQTAGDIGNKLLKLDPGHFILRTMHSLEKKAVSFEQYLKLFQEFQHKLQLNVTKGNFIQAVINKATSLLTDKNTLEFLKQTVMQVFNLLPVDLVRNIRESVSEAKMDLLAGGPMRRMIFFGGPVRRMIFSKGPIRRFINFMFNIFLRPLRYIFGVKRTPP